MLDICSVRNSVSALPDIKILRRAYSLGAFLIPNLVSGANNRYATVLADHLCRFFSAGETCERT